MENYKQGKKCKNDNERRERLLASYHRYNTKKYHCVQCNKELSLGNRAGHLKTKIHLKNDINYVS